MFCFISAVVVYHFLHNVQKMWHMNVQTATGKLVCTSALSLSLEEEVGEHIREEQIMTSTMEDQLMIMCHQQMTEDFIFIIRMTSFQILEESEGSLV